MSVDMRTFLAESIEYAAVRVAIALEAPGARLARWQVTIEPAQKAVAS
jgi:hypothetical protein